jgi:hypothetical protein
MDINEAIEHALNGNALLFVGSGFSIGCKNINNNDFPVGSMLADTLYKILDETSDGDLITASEMFIEEKGRDELVKLLQNTFTAKKLTTDHCEIANVNWRNIYTTNYDDVLEKVFLEKGLKKSPITCENDVYEYAKNKNTIIHINGFVDFLHENSLQAAFKLTDTSYLTETFFSSPWAYAFRKDLKLAKSVIFIGYSMYDLDIRRILNDSPDLKGKTFFVTESSPSKKMIFNLKRFGQIETIELSGLVKKIKSKAESWSKVTLPIIYNSLIKFSGNRQLSVLNDKDIFELHLYGSLKTNLLDTSHQDKYLLYRKCNANIIESIENCNDTLIHASLGNGKTVIVNQIANHFDELDYLVYQINTLESDWEEEIKELTSNSDNILLIVENYHRYIDAIKYFNLHRKRNHKLLLTERSDINDIKIDSLDFLDENLNEFDVNKLDRNSTENMVKNFNEFGLWGKSAALQFREKSDKIKRDYKSEFSNVLLDVFESPNIKEKVDQLILDVKTDQDHRDLIIFAAVTSILGYEFNHYDAAAYLDSDAIFGASLRNGSEFRQLVGLEDSKVSIKSSILAKHLLFSVGNPNYIVDMLVTIIKKAYELSNYDSSAKYIAKDLVRFGNIQSVIPMGKNRTAAITRYYEQIKNLGRNSGNPHFWLQYAISQLTIGDVDSAEKYFENAYSFAKKSQWYETEPLDNHYARFLLEKATDENDIAQAFPQFEKAHFSLRKQKRRHYPYKVAIGYAAFYNKHKTELDTPQITKLRKYCEDVIANISRLDQRTKAHRNVNECLMTLETVITDIKA